MVIFRIGFLGTIRTDGAMGGLFQYNFFINAILAAALASITCGIVGTYIVSRRLVFISGGITHASFGGIGMAYYLGLNPFLGATIFALLSAFGIEYFSGNKGLRQDSAIGIFWSLGMAIGILFIFLHSGYTPNLMGYLFGSILTVNRADLAWMLALAVLVVLVFIFFYRLILYVAFDEEYARTKRVPVIRTNYLLISLVSLTIILNIRVVGVILVISFLTLPQVTANIISHHFKHIIFYSVIIALIGSVSGIIVSYYLDLPSGPVIICCFMFIFLCTRLFYYLTVRPRLSRRD